MEGFLALQKAVDESIMKELKQDVNLETVEVKLQRFPYPAYRIDIFSLTFWRIMPVVILVCFSPALICMAEDIVKEKETMLRVTTLLSTFSFPFLESYLCTI